ncbi:MAG: hypothetical protein ACLTKQ_03865 [Acutalibacteraceae bacterium]
MKYIIDYIIVFTDWLITAIKDILLLLWNVILIVVEAGKFFNICGYFTSRFGYCACCGFGRCLCSV